MQTKSFLIYLLFILCHFPCFGVKLSFSSNNEILSNDVYIQALASLLFHTQEREKNLAFDKAAEEIVFAGEDISHLWNKVHQGVYLNFSHLELSQHLFLFNKALQDYQQADDSLQKGQIQESLNFLNNSSQILKQLWQEAIEKEKGKDIFLEFTNLLFVRGQKDPNVYNNPYISQEAQDAMKPYLLPLNHSKRSALDAIFLKTRATQDKSAFYKAGFKILDRRPRSFICVARHAKLHGYLVKAYLDTELKEKYHKASWEWLVRRCQGAHQIRDIIKRHNIRHFVVANKWIYCLPAEPSPPLDDLHTRHLALLLVTDMKLTSHRENLYAWYHYITEEYLDELFVIISRAKGSSYRADNIAYTNQEQFAFIDTEYPSRGPDFTSIRKYLNPEMCDYWDQLVQKGGFY